MAPHPDGLVAAKRAAIEGRCVFCEEPLPRRRTGRPNSITCGARACVRAAQRAWHRDDYRRRKAA